MPCEEEGKPSDPSRRRTGRALGIQARETSGVTSALLLGYLDRVGGPDAVAQVLRRCGLGDCEADLRDENSWFSWETKIALFEAAADVLGKADFMDEMAAYGLDASVASGHKVALRTLGSPQFILRNIVSANARFNRSHVLELLDLGDGHALVRLSEIGGGHRYHRLDCDYTAAMLGLIPGLFGLGLFEMHWTERPRTRRHAIVAAGATAAGLAAAAVLAPVAVPFVAAGGLVAGGLLVRERQHWCAEQLRHLERQVHDSEQVTQRLLESFQDVVSDLRLEEVVAKVTRNAQTAVGGREFLLFVREGGRLVCQSSSSPSMAVVGAIDAWANASPRLLEQSLAIDDVSRLSGLAPLLALDSPLCSLASAPLRSRGEPFGLLVALGGQQRMFLPRDVSVLESYAAQVAIALSNARLYQNERSLAARDPLSGLLNHRSFHEAVDTELARCTREQLYSSVVLIDLDAFKSVNDADGHAAGDRLLRATARVISDTCRREDLAFRVGGDEFALLLPALIWNEAVVVAKRVCSAIAELDPRIGASAGIACAGPNDHDKDEVLARADARLYAAKRGDVAPLHDGGISTGRGGEPRDRSVR